MKEVFPRRLHPYQLFAFLLLCLLIKPLTANELNCQQPYTVSTGDSLSSIAKRAYGDASQYSIIYYANLNILTAGPSVIRLGQTLRLPCLDEATTVTAAAESTNAAEASNTSEATTTTNTEAATTAPPAKLQLLTAGDYVPFTDKSLPNGGLITELVEAALKHQKVDYELSWVNDWSAHLDPLLKTKRYDLGFPWANPGCPAVEDYRCQFIFSNSIFNLLDIMYTRVDKPLTFEKDDDMIGHSLCRPSGYFTHDLDRPGREWLKKKLITLKQPQAVKDCFELLMKGEVDAVSMNDFTGRESIAKLGLQDKVFPLPRELSLNGLYVITHESHPQAQAMIDQVNAGLEALQANGEYSAILDKHLKNHLKTVEALLKQ